MMARQQFHHQNSEVNSSSSCIHIPLFFNVAFISKSLSPVDCIFKILPMQRYAAQEQFKRATQSSTKTMPEVAILKKLQVTINKVAKLICVLTDLNKLGV